MPSDPGRAILAKIRAGKLAEAGVTSTAPNTLGRGGMLLPGQAMLSANKQFLGFMQPNGNFVVYNLDPKARDADIWSTNTHHGTCIGKVLAVNGDGNVCVYPSVPTDLLVRKGDYRSCWNAKTSGHPRAVLALQNDGNLVIYDGAWREGAKTNPRALWSSGTYGGVRASEHHHGFLSSIGHWASHAVSSATKVISKATTALEHLPVIGGALKTGIHITGAITPFGLAMHIASGERLDHALLHDLHDKLRATKEVAPYAAMIPGVGTAVATATTMLGSLGAKVVSSNEVLTAGKALLPATDHHGFDVGAAVMTDPNLTAAKLLAIRKKFTAPGDRRGFDTAISMQSGMATSNAPPKLAGSASAKAAFYATMGMQHGTAGMKLGMLKAVAITPAAKAGVVAAAAEVKNKTFVQKVKEFFGFYDHRPFKASTRPRKTRAKPLPAAGV